MLDRLRRFRERFPLQAIAIEVFAIVLGVLFALYVKDWRNERERAALAQRALKSFEQEVCSNQRRIQEVLPYHKAMRDTFQYVLEKRTLQTFRDLYDQVGFRGYRTISPLNAAMKTARSTGAIGLFDYEITQGLVRIYSVQEELDEIGEQLLAPPSLTHWASTRTTSTML